LTQLNNTQLFKSIIERNKSTDEHDINIMRSTRSQKTNLEIMSNKDKYNDSKKVSIDFYDNDVSNIYKNISNSNYKKNFQRKSTHNIRHNSLNANANTRATLNQNVFSDTNLNQSNNDFNQLS